MGKQVKPSSLRSLAHSNVLRFLQQEGSQSASQCQTGYKSSSKVQSPSPVWKPCPAGTPVMSWSCFFFDRRQQKFLPITPSSLAEPRQPSDKSHFSHLHSKSHPPGPGYPRHMLKSEGRKPSGDNLVISRALLSQPSSPSPRRCS